VWNEVVKATPRRSAQRRAAQPSGPSVAMCSASGWNASIIGTSRAEGAMASWMLR
jgi:hypothetical protein